MEIGVGVYETPGSAAALSQNTERKDSEERQAVALARDTVSISDAARERLQLQESGETEDGTREGNDGGAHDRRQQPHNRSAE